MKLRYADVVVG